MHTISNAWQDIRAGFRMRHVWTALAWEDIGDQHRRTTLGPLWMLINYLAFAGTFVFLFKGGITIPHYEAYVAIGLFVWFYIMEIIGQSISLFEREQAFIKGTSLPITIYVMRQLMQAVIRSSYALVGCIAILLFSDISWTLAGLAWALLGVVLIITMSPAAITFLAFLGAYFPDSKFLVSNMMRLAMFLTPIFWTHTLGEGGIRGIVYSWNPFTYLLEVVRTPIINGQMPTQALIITAVLLFTLWILALVMLGKLRKKVLFIL